MAIEASTTVLRDVSNSLKNLIVNNINDMNEGSVSFESPGEYDPTGAKSISQFLYQVKLNDYLRYSGRLPAELEGGGVSVSELREPPIVVDLMYMLTPFGPDPVAEMEIIEKIMGILYDNPVLKDDLLAGNLQEVGNDKIRITPVDLGTEVLNNIWSIFPNKAYKVSLFYTLSPVRIISNKVFDGKRVTTKEIDYYKIK